MMGMVQGDTGVRCICGGPTLERRPGETPRRIACPRCGRTPLDLVKKRNDAGRKP